MDLTSGVLLAWVRRYCLGNTAMDLLTEFSARRRLILRSLFSSSR
eukprot:COSAG04_NODE_11915_length_681_cov_0.654639_2_plen_44_part_01